MAYIGNTPADKYQTLQKQSFTTSATTSYTLSYSVSSPQDIALFINNVRQNPNSSYTVSGTTLTLSSATTGTDVMYAVFLGKSVGTIAPALNSVTTSMMASGVLPTNTPAFRARLSSNQSIPNNTQTKMALATEDWDTDSAFDSSTNYRFTVPSGKAGKYVFTASITAENIDDNEFFSFNLYLNGSAEQLTGQAKQFSPGSNQTLRFTSIAYISLSVGDYIEAYVSHNEGAAINLRSAESSFGGFKLIGV